jgi:DNA-binding response OmpR family regulator
MPTNTIPTVVFVEDDPEIAEVLSVVLSDMGYRAVACPMVPYATQYIVDMQPDLVILDVRMGRIDGVDLFQHLRADPAMHDVPVIFFTATEQRVASRVPHYRDMGAEFVIKPNIAQLGDCIERLLGSKGS